MLDKFLCWIEEILDGMCVMVLFFEVSVLEVVMELLGIWVL